MGEDRAEADHMTPQELAIVPDVLLARSDTAATTGLLVWLRVRGLSMTLLELEQERERRGIAPDVARLRRQFRGDPRVRR
jgi:hypothetical protein